MDRINYIIFFLFNICCFYRLQSEQFFCKKIIEHIRFLRSWFFVNPILTDFSKYALLFYSFFAGSAGVRQHLLQSRLLLADYSRLFFLVGIFFLLFNKLICIFKEACGNKDYYNAYRKSGNDTDRL